MNAYSYFLVRPTYKSTAKMYVVSASKNSVVDLDALNIGTSLTADYEQLMLSYPVLEQVINKLNLDMDSDTLAKMITLENPTDTRILNINVVSTDPKSARDIANTLMDVSVDYLPKTMSTNAPNVAQKAKLADHKDGPSYTKYTMIGALAGAFLYCMDRIIQHHKGWFYVFLMMLLMILVWFVRKGYKYVRVVGTHKTSLCDVTIVPPDIK